MSFTSKTAVITGAGSGIGRALAVNLAGRGARLALSDVNKESLDETLELVRHVEARGYQLDVSSREAILAHADEVVRDFGTVNLVVNNAGVAVGARVDEMSFADLDWLLSINLMGMINGSMAFLPHLIASGDGHLANLSSVFGFIAPPTQSAYCAAKFGVRGFTEAMRQEMIIQGFPVTVHCVHPGGIKTNIGRNGRFIGKAEDADEAFEKAAKTTPEQAAAIILRGIERNKARILIGRDAYFFLGVQQVLGSKYQGIFSAMARRYDQRKAAAEAADAAKAAASGPPTA